MTNTQATGSFTGSFTGEFIGDIQADSVAYENITGKPTLVSGSEQIVISDTDGYTAFSSSLAVDIAANATAIGNLDGNYATDAELNASSSALINGYETADTTLSASLAADIAAIDTAVPAIIDNGGTPAYNTGITKAEVLSILNVEDGADVTDTDNVTAAGALMDSEVTSLSGIKSLTVPDNTTISSFGASLVDDADAAAARTTLGVDPAGTDNSTDVTLAGSYDYITITGQTITRNQIDLSTDVTGVLPVSNMSATALTTVQTASSQAAQLALTAQEGDVVVRTDENKTYMHNGGTAGTMADYTLLATPTDAVTSVNGNTGAVTVVENVTTNLSTTANGTSLVINSSDGTNASIPAATTSAWGAMTDEDKTKLNGIETGADVTDTENVVAALTAGTNITIAANGTISSTDTVYTHPTHPGDDIDVDTGALTGATVISDLDFNVTTDTSGHVTDANATVATRTLTAGDLGLGSGDNVTFTEVSSSGASEFVGGASIGMSRHSTNPFGGNYGYLQLKDSMGIFSSTDNDKMHGLIDADATNGLRLRGSKSGTFGTYGLVLDYGGGYSFEGSMNGVINDVVHIDGFPATFEVGNSTWYTAGDKPSVTFYSSINVKDDVVAYHSSDKRFKDNIVEIDSSLEKVESLRGVYFDWNDKQDIYKGHDIGVIAQEVEEVLPEIVETREDGYKAVKYEKLTAVLIQAVKELSARVKELENK